MRRSRLLIAGAVAAGLAGLSGCETLKAAAPTTPQPISEHTTPGGTSGVTSGALGESTGGTQAGPTDMGTETPARPLATGGAGKAGVPVDLEKVQKRSTNSGSLSGSGSHLGGSSDPTVDASG